LPNRRGDYVASVGVGNAAGKITVSWNRQ
jgi:hypothetical protein